jgi:acylphosphatase
VKRVHLVITGRVQGVWYRASARNEGERLGVAGWVRNREDGAVEAVVEGTQEQLDAFIAWCRRGPPAARVDDVATEWSEPRGEAPGFTVRR